MKGTKVVVAGLGKSGTTALYYAIKQSLPAYYSCLFEPARFEPNDNSSFVFAKVLINTVQSDDFDRFDKRILIVRDPRDNLVSWLLYYIYNTDLFSQPGKFNEFLALLDEKRKNPARVSLLEVLSLLARLSGNDLLRECEQRHKLALRFESGRPAYFVYKYEDFVVGDFATLQDYLGFNVIFSGDVDPGLRRVTRTKRAGDWRNWFTPADVDYFRSLFHPYIAHYGYNQDWTTNPTPQIPPQYSTEYVVRLIRERRELSGNYKHPSIL